MASSKEVKESIELINNVTDPETKITILTRMINSVLLTPAQCHTILTGSTTAYKLMMIRNQLGYEAYEANKLIRVLYE